MLHMMETGMKHDLKYVLKPLKGELLYAPLYFLLSSFVVGIETKTILKMMSNQESNSCPIVRQQSAVVRYRAKQKTERVNSWIQATTRL